LNILKKTAIIKIKIMIEIFLDSILLEIY